MFTEKLLPVTNFNDISHIYVNIFSIAHVYFKVQHSIQYSRLNPIVIKKISTDSLTISYLF